MALLSVDLMLVCPGERELWKGTNAEEASKQETFTQSLSCEEFEDDKGRNGRSLHRAETNRWIFLLQNFQADHSFSLSLTSDQAVHHGHKNVSPDRV